MIVVFDLEQTAWPGSMARDWSGPGEHPEIIQVGAVRLGADLAETGALDLVVRPRLNPVLSDFIIGLTGLTQERVDREGIDIAEALSRLAGFAEGAGAMLCNGADDGWIRRNVKLLGIADPLSDRRFISLSRHFRQAAGSEAHVTSSRLPEILGFPMPGRAHDGLGDARAIAEAVRRTLPAGGIDSLLR